MSSMALPINMKLVRAYSNFFCGIVAKNTFYASVIQLLCIYIEFLF